MSAQNNDLSPSEPEVGELYGPETLQALGSADATVGLNRKAPRDRVVTAAVWRAVKLTDMVTNYAREPNFELLLAAWERGFDTTWHAALPATNDATGTSSASTSSMLDTTVEQLFTAAFNKAREPHSGEYMDGARAALAYRIEGAQIGSPHPVGTSAADAYFSGIEEGHAIWRSASGNEQEAADNLVGRRQQFLAIVGNADDINAQVEHIEILLDSVFEKLDELSDEGAAARQLAAINCFATCALRNVILIAEANDQIVALATEGGAA